MRIYIGGGVRIESNCKECDKIECPEHPDYVEPIDMTKNGESWEVSGFNITNQKQIRGAND